jgi:hypothetical protein
MQGKYLKDDVLILNRILLVSTTVTITALAMNPENPVATKCIVFYEHSQLNTRMMHNNV